MDNPPEHERHASRPDDRKAPASCSPAHEMILGLWAEGDLESTLQRHTEPRQAVLENPRGDDARDEGSTHDGRGESSLVAHGLRPDGRTVDPGVLRHIESCPECLREVRELAKLSRALTTGIEQLGTTVGRTMEAGIERTLRGLREEPFDARMLRRSRRALRLVLWAALLGLSLAAFCTLLIAVYQAIVNGGP